LSKWKAFPAVRVKIADFYTGAAHPTLRRVADNDQRRARGMQAPLDLWEAA